MPQGWTESDRLRYDELTRSGREGRVVHGEKRKGTQGEGRQGKKGEEQRVDDGRREGGRDREKGVRGGERDSTFTRMRRCPLWLLRVILHTPVPFCASVPPYRSCSPSLLLPPSRRRTWRMQAYPGGSTGITQAGSPSLPACSLCCRCCCCPSCYRCCSLCLVLHTR